MRFDLSKVPTAQEIAEETHRRETDLVNMVKLWERNGVARLALIFFSLCFTVYAACTPNENVFHWGGIGVFIAFILMFCSDPLNYQVHHAEKDLEDLKNVEIEHSKHVLELCKKHPELAAYQSQVTATGRVLTKGEVEAMKKWVDEKDDREAFELLKHPVAQ